MGSMGAVRDLSSEALLARVEQLVGRDRRLTVDLLVHLGEVDARRLYAEQACSSMFAWCTRHLGFGEAVAYSRIRAARLGRRFPVILAYLAAGRIHLASVALLGAHLTEANCEKVLRSVRGKSKREVEELVAELHPRPDVASRVRKLPARGRDALEAPPVGQREAAPSQAEHGAKRSMPEPPSRRAVVAPLAPERFRVQFTATREQVNKLEHLQDLLGHQVPSGDLAEVVERAVDALTERLEARKNAKVKRPRAGASPGTGRSRRVPAAVRREVSRRDGSQCAFVDRRGRRCEETRCLEYDHVRPVGKGGEHSVGNVRLLCRAHNQHAARKDYGDEYMERAMARRRETEAARSP